ncbi:AMP-binding protein, partial [Myxococcota bacterium]|nr:AMP-binding protein [Myxococcota bacterium]
MTRHSAWRQRLGTIRGLSRLIASARYLKPKGPGSVAGLLEERVRRDPDGLALAWQDQRFTWSELDQHARRYAVFFQTQGVRKGDVVALVMENRPDYLFAVMGLARLGAPASLINHNLVDRALLHALQVCGARSVLVGSECLEALDDIRTDLSELGLEGQVWIRSDESDAPSTDSRVVDEAILS